MASTDSVNCQAVLDKKDHLDCNVSLVPHFRHRHPNDRQDPNLPKVALPYQKDMAVQVSISWVDRLTPVWGPIC